MVALTNCLGGWCCGVRRCACVWRFACGMDVWYTYVPAQPVQRLHAGQTQSHWRSTDGGPAGRRRLRETSRPTVVRLSPVHLTIITQASVRTLADPMCQRTRKCGLRCGCGRQYEGKNVHCAVRSQWHSRQEERGAWVWDRISGAHQHRVHAAPLDSAAQNCEAVGRS